MKAKEYREREQITDANFWNGNEIDFNMIYEFAEDYHKAKLKLLGMANFSQQRELLIEFARWHDINFDYSITFTRNVDDFLKEKIK